MQDHAIHDLSQGQKCRITTTLAILDEALCEFEQWAEGREMKSIFYREQNELQPDQREAIKNRVVRIREKLRELRDGLQIEVNSRSAVQRIWSQCSILWVSLIEVTSKHLKGYGDVPGELSDYLDPKVAELIALTNEIAAVIKKA